MVTPLARPTLPGIQAGAWTMRSSASAGRHLLPQATKTSGGALFIEVRLERLAEIITVAALTLLFLRANQKGPRQFPID